MKSVTQGCNEGGKGGTITHFPPWHWN